jgi:hypothetical protein
VYLTDDYVFIQVLPISRIAMPIRRAADDVCPMHARLPDGLGVQWWRVLSTASRDE